MPKRGGYTTSGSGKSMARALFAVIVFGVMAGFDISMWKGKDPNAAWATIITALTVPLGVAWAVGKRGKNAGHQAEAPGAPGEGGGA